jgi:3-isopropylmalate dehydrogenase
MKKIAILAGDGIGPEILYPALNVLNKLGDFSYDHCLFGGASYDRFKEPLTDETLSVCKKADAVLLSCVGGPQWDSLPAEVRPEQGLLSLRKELGVYANLRPIKLFPDLYDTSPLKTDRIQGVDLLVVRELTGGIYFGEKHRDADSASDISSYTKDEIERVARAAFDAAKTRSGKVTSIDKANVLETSRLWREVVTDLALREYPHIQLEHMLVDNAAMQLISAPQSLDVLLTDNMFGDILSDEASMLTGSIGLLASASVGAEGPGIFEPVHGSAPDIAGLGVANPLAMFLSCALLLKHLELEEEAKRLEAAIEVALSQGLRTKDLGGSASTQEATQTVLDNLV